MDGPVAFDTWTYVDSSAPTTFSDPCTTCTQSVEAASKDPSGTHLYTFGFDLIIVYLVDLLLVGLLLAGLLLVDL